MMRKVLKSLLVSTVMLFSVSIVNAKAPEDLLIDKYDGKKGFEVAIIGQDMLQMVMQMPMLSKEQKRFYEQTDEMIVIAYKGKNPTIESIYDEAMALFDAEAHTKSEPVSDKGVVGKAFAIEEGGFATKISVVMNMGKEVMVTVLKGKYDEASFQEAQKPQQKMF